MPIYHLRAGRFALLGFACAAAFIWLYLYWQVGFGSDKSRDYWEQFGPNETLAWRVARRLFVVSLHRRADRRGRLTPLLRAHQLIEATSSAGKQADVAGPYFQYVNATDSTEPIIQRILAHVRVQRKKEFESWKNGTLLRNEAGKRASFHDALGRSVEELWGSDLWVVEDQLSGERTFESQVPWDDMLDPDESFPILCEKGNPFNPKKFASIGISEDVGSIISASELPFRNEAATSQRPAINWLTPAIIACWYSHLQTIRQIATFEERDYRIIPDNTAPVFIVLEDDVDFEWSTPLLLSQLMPSLPTGWEILFLGHCWSDEARHPPLHSTFFPPSDSLVAVNPRTQKRVALHPANSPLCTHAYALSPQGARKLYNLLRHPAFAFSRPLDQAISWLIRNGYLKQSYSIVPSLVVQTKEGKSDISERRGSRWRDTLVDSTREKVRKGEQGASWKGWFGT